MLPVVLMVLAASACLPPFVGPPDAPKAVVMGDSLIFQAGFSGDIERTFVSRNWQVSIAGAIAGNTQMEMPNIVDAAIKAPRAVVLNHATSDVNATMASLPVNKASSRAAIKAAVTTALDTLSSIQCVVVVTANEGSSVAGFAAEARTYNSWLVPLVQSHPNATWLDWTAYSAGHPDWFAPADGVHLEAPGMVALADIMETTARTCGRW